MGFFSEIIQDSGAGNTSATSGFMRSNNSSNGMVDQGVHSHDLSSLSLQNSAQKSSQQSSSLQKHDFQNDSLKGNPNAFPLADANIDSDTHIPRFSKKTAENNGTHNLMREAKSLSNDNFQSSKLSNQDDTPEVEGEEFNFADEQSIEDNLEIDLAAQLHRVQVERSLKTRSRVRDNVPCSEESQMINPKGGDSDEHLHEIIVNKSSIDRKQMSDAENARDYKSDSEFIESSSVERECDKNFHNSRNISDESFYDRKVELTKSQINERESRTSTDVEDINLRNSQGLRTLPGRYTEGPERYTKGPGRLENWSEHYTKGYRANKNSESAEGKNSIDMTSIFSELESAVSALSSASTSSKPNDRYRSASQKAKSEAETQIEDLFELNGKKQLGSKRSNNRAQKLKNKPQSESSSSKANLLQPKVSIGQIDVIVTSAPESKSESTGASSSANPFSSASSNQSNSSSYSSKNYTRRI